MHEMWEGFGLTSTRACLTTRATSLSNIRTWRRNQSGTKSATQARAIIARPART